MFSDALREMDRNTERYMVEELNKFLLFRNFPRSLQGMNRIQKNSYD